jgi:hypothetical protein
MCVARVGLVPLIVFRKIHLQLVSKLCTVGAFSDQKSS